MMVPAGGGRSGGKKKSKKGSSSDSNTGMVIGLSVGIGGLAILAAVLVFVFMGRGGGNAVATNTPSTPSGTSTTTPGTTATNPAGNPQSTAPSSPMSAHGSSSVQPTPMSTAPSAGPMSHGSSSSGGAQPTSTDPTMPGTQPMPEAVIAANTPSTGGGEAAPAGDGLPAVPSEPMALPELIRFVQPGVVRLEVASEFGGSIGSGFVVNKQGVIVTNYHVIAGAVNATAFFETGEGFPVTGAWHLDAERDIAILQIDCPADKLFPVNIATRQPAQGIDVAALGAPHGLSFTVTKGIVSAIRSGEELEHSGTLVQHDVSINPGNSGGPLVTFRGEVVAINTFLMSRSQNLNFAISCLDIRDCLDKQYSQMLAINPQNMPSKEGEIPGAVDYSDTERGEILLARIHEMDVVTLNMTQVGGGEISRYLERASEAQLKRTGIDTNQMEIYELSDIDFRNPVMLVIYHFALPEDDEVEALEVMVHMQVVMVDVTSEGKQEICIVWNREAERIGSVTLAALARGQLPNSIQNGVREFFGEFVSRYRRARNG